MHENPSYKPEAPESVFFERMRGNYTHRRSFGFASRFLPLDTITVALLYLCSSVAIFPLLSRQFPIDTLAGASGLYGGGGTFTDYSSCQLRRPRSFSPSVVSLAVSYRVCSQLRGSPGKA